MVLLGVAPLFVAQAQGDGKETGQMGRTSSDRTLKEKFRPVDGEEVLRKIRALEVTSWNFIGQDSKYFRHYGPMAQDFFASFGHDGVGTIGTPISISSTDIQGILMVAANALEKRTAALRKETESLRAENAALKARLSALERKVAGYSLARAGRSTSGRH